MPAVPCSGQNMCLTLSCQLSYAIIADGKLQMFVRYSRMIIYTDKHDVGTLLATAGTPLPNPCLSAWIKHECQLLHATQDYPGVCTIR